MYWVVCLRKFSSVCEVKWENEKNIFLCVLEWRGVYFLSEDTSSFAVEFGFVVHFYFGELLAGYENREETEKLTLWEYSWNFGFTYCGLSAIWTIWAQSWKGSWLFLPALTTQPILVSQSETFLQNQEKHPWWGYYLFCKKVLIAGEIGHSFGMIYGNDNAQGSCRQQQRNTLSCNYRELTTLWEQGRSPFRFSK